MSEQILDLSQLERDTFKLEDGTELELRNPTEFGPLDEFKFRSLSHEIAKYDPTKIKTEADAQKYAEVLHSLAAMIVIGLPDEVSDASCAAIYGVWIQKHSANPQRPTRPPRDRQPKKKSIGAK